MQTLTDDFKQKFGIAEVHKCFDNSGQKIVYIVTDNKGRKIALKRFRSFSPRDDQEIAMLRKFLELPGIPKLLDVVEYEGSPLLYEEYIDAPDLEDIATEYAGNAEKIMKLMQDMINILEPVWRERIVHRDLKPKNIKILPDGTPVILDFGIARDLSAESITASGSGQPMTWDYASPEQYRSDKGSISYRTDFFALGLIAYRLYYQKHPYGNNKGEIESRFANKNGVALEDDCPLKDFLSATLQIDPSARARNAEILIKTTEI